MTAKYQKIANNEISASEYLRYSSAISDAVVKTLDGAYLTTWRVAVSYTHLDVYKRQI